MSNILVSIPMSIDLISKIEKLAKDNNKDFNNFIIDELNKIGNNKSKRNINNTMSATEIIEKYRRIGRDE